MLTGWIGFVIWLGLFATAGILWPRRRGLSGFLVLALSAFPHFDLIPTQNFGSVRL